MKNKKKNRKYWIDLENIVEEKVDETPSGISRRSFMELLGLSFISLSCTKFEMPVEKIIPIVNKITYSAPGKSNYYASTCRGCSAGCGILVKVRDGRPIKLEGNPAHPINRGGLCVVGQASILNLYNKNRVKTPGVTTPQDSVTSLNWDVVDNRIINQLNKIKESGKKIVLLSNTINGPSTIALLSDFKKEFPSFVHHSFEPFSSYAISEAHRITFNKSGLPCYNFDRADIIVSFDADFLGSWISPVEFTSQYTQFKDRFVENKSLKHVQFESKLSLTGAQASERISISPTFNKKYLFFLATIIEKKLNKSSLSIPSFDIDERIGRKIYKLASDLIDNRGKSLVVSGINDISVQLLVNYLNFILDNYENTLSISSGSFQSMSDDKSIDSLVAEMDEGKVGAIFISGINLPFAFKNGDSFLKSLQKVELSVSFCDLEDETSRYTKYHCPAGHYIESWKDAQSVDSLFSIGQPTITPLYKTRSLEDSLLSWMGQNVTFYDYMRNHWKDNIFVHQTEYIDFEKFWEKTLINGFVTFKNEKKKKRVFDFSSFNREFEKLAVEEEYGDDSICLDLYQSVALRDGSFAQNPYLLELPDPITKVSWTNCALISPFLQKKLKLKDGQFIKINAKGKEFKIPARVQPGQHKRTISVALGYGVLNPLDKGKRVGVNLFPFLDYKQNNGYKYYIDDVDLEPLNEYKKLALSQTEDILHDRPIILDEKSKDSHKTEEHHNLDKMVLWEGHEFHKHKWELVIDLNKCTGCSACVVSCAIENNIPFVGEDEVRRRRDLYWMRIDRYYKGNKENPTVRFQPMLCQQCNNAPCESVCPVLATVQSSEGLNMQVYNRCVGTRFCANNCPYKTRRFNWFEYKRDDFASTLILNPDVTVRSRGVMEKCTFCIQRIEEIKIKAKKSKRNIEDGEIKLACEQSCPSNAIIFGDANDPNGRIFNLMKEKRNFKVLEELHTKPSVTYLKKIIL